MKGQNAPIPPVELDEAGGGDAIGVPQWMIAAVVSAALTVQPGRLKQGGITGVYAENSQLQCPYC